MKSRIRWQFSEEQIQIINTKSRKNRLYFAIQLKYYESKMAFCEDIKSFSSHTISKISKMLEVPSKLNHLSLKTIGIYRKEIRNYFQTRKLNQKEELLLKNWLVEEVFSLGSLHIEGLKEKAILFLKSKKIENIQEASLERLLKSIRYQYESSLFKELSSSLDPQTKAYLDGLLLMTPQKVSRIGWLQRWPGGVSIKTILKEAEKLEFLNLLTFPEKLHSISQKELLKYYRYIVSSYPSNIKKMPEAYRYGYLTIFTFVKQRQVVDNLVDLLIRLTQKFLKAGTRKLQREASRLPEIKKNYSKNDLLQALIQAILNNEDKVVREAIYPNISKEDLLFAQSAEEAPQSLGYNRKLNDSIRKSYIYHYRRMIVPVLDLLEFYSHNLNDKLLIQALDHIKKHAKDSSPFYPHTDAVPLKNVLQKNQKALVLEETATGTKINRINYEIYVLKNLRDKLRFKEVWVSKSYQYRDPEKDLPQDFDTRREYYYGLLNKEPESHRFILKLKRKLRKVLSEFNRELKTNPSVQILKKPQGHIKVTPLEPQNTPSQLEAIKQEVFKKWPDISLLDVLKETDLFVNFLDSFIPSGPREKLDKETLRTRLLLIIQGYGTNTGLKTMVSGDNNVTYSELLHTKLRYLDPENLRQAIRIVINQLLHIRMPEIWGNCTTSVASDSTFFEASDQNLMSRWHPRYHGVGVMVYWHVDKNSLCIYSQLKSCVSSEVAAMIEGVLRHCTNMEVQKNYVDTHGASEVGFAFSYLLCFQLLPRFKNIHQQRLYIAEKGDTKKYANLTSILKRHIHWASIEAQYDQMIKYATALKIGTASAEMIMDRFKNQKMSHPVYKGLSELGKALKTIFLCQYLMSEPLRQEIHEGLNVVERWNGVNDFISYGKTGAFRSNKPEELKISMLCLHLLQLSLVYINTVMLQQVIQESNWLPKMTMEDKRAISPLLSEHINPYGKFILNLNDRIPLSHPPIQRAA